MSECCPTCGTSLAQHKPKPERRISCEGGCGVWWYQAPVGRPRRFCPRCYLKNKSARRHLRGKVVEALGRRL